MSLSALADKDDLGIAGGPAPGAGSASVVQTFRFRLGDPYPVSAPAQTGSARFDVRASFATAFRKWRLKRKLPLKQVASDLGVGVATINSWELGKRFPSGRHFEMLVNYTGLPPCKLFCVMADKCVPAECLLAMGRKA